MYDSSFCSYSRGENIFNFFFFDNNLLGVKMAKMGAVRLCTTMSRLVHSLFLESLHDDNDYLYESFRCL